MLAEPVICNYEESPETVPARHWQLATVPTQCTRLSRMWDCIHVPVPFHFSAHNLLPGSMTAPVHVAG